jgi:hypothetical protein
LAEEAAEVYGRIDVDLRFVHSDSSARKRDMHISPGRCSFVDNKGVKWHLAGKVETNPSHWPVLARGRACPP